MSDNNIQDLYQKGATESTPPSLDNFILAQAKNSCDPKQTNNKRKLLYSLSTAAVVVMSFSVIFNLQHENESMSVQPEYINAPQSADIGESTNKSKATKKEEINEPQMAPTAPKKLNTLNKLSRNNTVNSQIESKREVISPIAKEPAGLDLVSQDMEITDETSQGFIANEEIIDAYAAPVPEIDDSSEEVMLNYSEPMAESIPNEITEDSAADDIVEVTIESTEPKVEPVISAYTATDMKKSGETEATTDESIVVIGARKVEKTAAKTSNQPQKGSLTTKERKRESKSPNTAYRLGVDLTLQIKLLDDLITDEKFQQAKTLLKQLKHSYPSYDFSKYEDILKDR